MEAQMTIFLASPTREEAKFQSNEIMVTQSDLTGKLIYCNDTYCRVMEITTAEARGQSIDFCWHPDMPRSLLKRVLASDPNGLELFLYIKHMTKSGKFIWVLAQISSLYDQNNEHIGFNSIRRHVKPEVVQHISDLYRSLQSEEQRHADPEAGIAAGEALLDAMLADQGHDYPQFIWSILG